MYAVVSFTHLIKQSSHFYWRKVMSLKVVKHAISKPPECVSCWSFWGRLTFRSHSFPTIPVACKHRRPPPPPFITLTRPIQTALSWNKNVWVLVKAITLFAVSHSQGFITGSTNAFCGANKHNWSLRFQHETLACKKTQHLMGLLREQSCPGSKSIPQHNFFSLYSKLLLFKWKGMA